MSPNEQNRPPLLSGRKDEKDKRFSSARSKNEELKNSLSNAAIIHEEGLKSDRAPPKANIFGKKSVLSYED